MIGIFLLFIRDTWEFLSFGDSSRCAAPRALPSLCAACRVYRLLIGWDTMQHMGVRGEGRGAGTDRSGDWFVQTQHEEISNRLERGVCHPSVAFPSRFDAFDVIFSIFQALIMLFPNC